MGKCVLKNNGASQSAPLLVIYFSFNSLFSSSIRYLYPLMSVNGGKSHICHLIQILELQHHELTILSEDISLSMEFCRLRSISSAAA